MLVLCTGYVPDLAQIPVNEEFMVKGNFIRNEASKRSAIFRKEENDISSFRGGEYKFICQCGAIVQPKNDVNFFQDIAEHLETSEKHKKEVMKDFL